VQQSCGTGADVAVLDRNPEALRRVDAVLGNRVRTLFSTRDVVELLCPRADLVIATVLVPGSTTPKLIRAQVKAVKTGAMASFGTIEGPIHS
jgi:alanine dehydrogenase